MFLVFWWEGGMKIYEICKIIFTRKHNPQGLFIMPWGFVAEGVSYLIRQYNFIFFI